MTSIRYAKLLFIGIPAAFLLCACGKQADTSATKTAPKVVYTKPVVRDIVLWDDYTAKIEAIASVNIRAQVGGYLKSINFKEGENVKKGDLLFVIDPRPYSGRRRLGSSRPARIQHAHLEESGIAAVVFLAGQHFFKFALHIAYIAI